jgi:short-subunit dehydrogenase
MLDLNCQVICIDFNQSRLDELKTALIKKYPTNSQRIFFYNVDVTNTEQVEACAAKIKLEVGLPVDILINNAGIFNKGKLLTELSETEIRNIFNVNILGQMWLCRQFLPDMLSRNKGHIINMVRLFSRSVFDSTIKS